MMMHLFQIYKNCPSSNIMKMNPIVTSPPIAFFQQGDVPWAMQSVQRLLLISRHDK